MRGQSLAALLVAVLLSGCAAPLNPATGAEAAPGDDPLAPRLVPELTPDPEYQGLRGHKAQAVSYSAGTAYRHNSSHQATPAAAAVVALRRCNAARSQRGAANESACELLRQGDRALAPAALLRAQLPATPHPLFLWRLVRDGRTQGYLAGSIHLLKESLLPPPAAYLEAFAASDQLVLEIDTSQIPPEDILGARQRWGTLPGGQTLWSLMTPAQAGVLGEYLEARGIASDTVASLKPGMLALEVAVAEYIAIGYLPQFGVESFFEARRGERPILGLETIDEQLAAATALPLDLQTDVLLEGIEDTEEMPDMVNALLVAWLSGDNQRLLRLFTDYNSTDATRRWLDELLDKRNLTMAERIEPLLDGGATPFILVGAAHLLGPGSVVDRLRRKGWSIEQLHSDYAVD